MPNKRTNHSPLRPTGANVDGRYKTKLCKHWQKLGRCRFGDRCLFAHGEHELRCRPCDDAPLGSPELYGASPPLSPASPPLGPSREHAANNISPVFRGMPGPACQSAREEPSASASPELRAADAERGPWEQPNQAYGSASRAMADLSAQSRAMDAQWRTRQQPQPCYATQPYAPHRQQLQQPLPPQALPMGPPPGFQQHLQQQPPASPPQPQHQEAVPAPVPSSSDQEPVPVPVPVPPLSKVPLERKSSLTSLLPAQLLRVTSSDVLRQSVKRFHTLFIPRNSIWAW